MADHTPHQRDEVPSTRRRRKPKPGWIELEMASAKRLADEYRAQEQRLGMSEPPRRRRRKRPGKRSASRNVNMDLLLAAQPMWPKMSKYSKELKMKSKSAPKIRVGEKGRIKHTSRAKAHMATKVSTPSFGSGEKRGIELLHKLREGAARPAPDGYQPDYGGSALNTGGGKFNMSKPKSDVEWEIYRAKKLPGPGHTQPKGGFNLADGIAGGGFNMSNPKSDIEWTIYRANKVPDPGHSQPKCGYSTMTQTGGKFNLSKPKSDVEWTIYRAKQLPAPGEHHPDGLFDLTHNPTGKATTGGKFNMSKAKSDIEWKMYHAKQVPGPADTQPECGFSTMVETGGNFNKGNSKGFVDWEIYRSSFLPSCAEYDEENKIGDFNAKTFNKVHEVQQQDALRRQLLKKKAKKVVKKAVMLTKMMSKSGGLLKAFGAQSPTKEPADDLSASTKMAFQSSSEVIKDSKKAAAGAAVQQ